MLNSKSPKSSCTSACKLIVPLVRQVPPFRTSHSSHHQVESHYWRTPKWPTDAVGRQQFRAHMASSVDSSKVNLRNIVSSQYRVNQFLFFGQIPHCCTLILRTGINSAFALADCINRSTTLEEHFIICPSCSLNSSILKKNSEGYLTLKADPEAVK